MSKFQVGDKVLRTKYLTLFKERLDRLGLKVDRTSPLTVSLVEGETICLAEVGDCVVFSEDFFEKLPEVEPVGIAGSATTPIYTGGSSDYYKVDVKSPTSGGKAYSAECNDIIEALGMNFAEGNAFKALWRRAAQRTLGLRKAGAKDDGLYDAEKVVFFGERLVAQSKEQTE